MDHKVKLVGKKVEWMLGNYNEICIVPMALRKGFTLIELLIAIAIIGLMMAAIIPMFQQQPGYERKQFIAHLNSLVQRAWQESIITKTVHRVVFDVKKREAIIEKNMTPTAINKLEFSPIKGMNAQFRWPITIDIKQFFIEGFDELKRFTGNAATSIWFYIIPDGMTQQVTINAVDRTQLIGEKRPRPFGLVLNPFLAQFKEYDTFQK